MEMEDFDRLELYDVLHLAALAGGMEFSRHHPDPMVVERREPSGIAVRITPWNPLKSDGDALDLLCKLMTIAIQIKLSISQEDWIDWSLGKKVQGRNFVAIIPWGYRTKNWTHRPKDFRGICEAKAITAQEATRKCIVMVAYELGRMIVEDTPDKS